MRPQIAKVNPAIESDRANQRRQPRLRRDAAPIRCQLWDHRRLVGAIPVTLNDMGHPTDVRFTPTSVERVTRISFVWGGRVFALPLPETVIISPGKPLHLALGHLRLLDRFGKDALRAGRA